MELEDVEFEEAVAAAVGGCPSAVGRGRGVAACDALAGTTCAFPLRAAAVLAVDRGGVDDVDRAVAEYVDWYNTRRLHGELGMVPPVEFQSCLALEVVVAGEVTAA